MKHKGAGACAGSLYFVSIHLIFGCSRGEAATAQHIRKNRPEAGFYEPNYILSITIAMPCPPPIHMVIRP